MGIGKWALPYGLLFIKSYLRKKNIDAFIFDREFNQDLNNLKRSFIEFNPEVVGISAMTLQASDAKKLIKLIREWKNNTIIVVGGIHFTAKPNDGLEYGADYVITGEGEIVLHKFMNEGPPIDKKIIQGEIISNLDDIPMLRMDDIRPFISSVEEYNKQSFHIITARGCPYNCNFCLSREQRPRGLRYHSIDYIVNFINKIVSEFKINTFFITDDIFVIKPSRVKEFCEKIKILNSNNLHFSCFSHAGHGNTELYKEMLSAGFYKIKMGVEHGNDEILAIMGKNTTKVKIEKTCEQIYKSGINLHLLYVLGNIKETNETISDTVNFAIHLHKKYKASSFFSYLQPLPGAPVYKIAKRYGEYLPKKRTYESTYLSYVPFDVSVKHIIKERRRGMILGNYNGPFKSYELIKFFAFLRYKTKNIWWLKRIFLFLLHHIALKLDNLSRVLKHAFIITV